jgi:organic hydroperoxide reductase OsmC/OhrA
MKPYPHHYLVEASAAASGSVDLRARGLPVIASAPPIEFGGPGDAWSPESLLVAATADCFVLTFRAVARASKLEWSSLQCSAVGTLDRIEKVTCFVGMRIEADLRLPAGGNAETGKRLLEKTEKTCLVSNSLDLAVALEARVTVAE